MLRLGFRLLLQIYKIIAAGVPTDRYYYNNLTLSPLRESGNLLHFPNKALVGNL